MVKGWQKGKIPFQGNTTKRSKRVAFKFLVCVHGCQVLHQEKVIWLHWVLAVA